MNGCTAEASFIEGIPVCINDPTVAANCVSITRDLLGQNVITNFPPISGSDDMYVCGHYNLVI